MARSVSKRHLSKRQTCQNCGNYCNQTVDTIVKGRRKIVCLKCFTELQERKEVEHEQGRLF